jgi:hypothetical protein
VRAPFYRWEEVELIAGRLHQQLAGLLGEPPALPIDVDLIGEQLLGLSWLYDRIPEPPGTTILAALHPELRLVVLNERHVDTFGRNEGLERFTKAHELGHWVLHSPRRSIARSPIPPVPAPAAERRWQEIQANWFAAALLLPPLPLKRAAAEVDVRAWRGRYELSGVCGVSVSALNCRLRQLGYPSVR